MLAALILALHLFIIAFNLVGMAIIPLGAWRGWSFVRAPLWRLLHLGSLGGVALQAAVGRPCFLTIWQAELEGRSHAAPPMITQWVNGLIFWPLPIWLFGLIYLVAFAYVAALLWAVPLRWRDWPNRRSTGTWRRLHP